LIVQAVVCIAIETYAFSALISRADAFALDWTQGALKQVFLGQLVTVIFESIYQIVLSLDAIRLRNAVQIFGICLNNLAMVIFIVLGFLSVTSITGWLYDLGGLRIDMKLFKGMPDYFVSVIVISSVSTIALGMVAWKLYTEFEW